MVSVLIHVVAIAVAVLGFGRQVPAAEVPASITVFMPPAPAAPPAPATPPQEAPPEEAKAAEAKPDEPPPPPEPDYALPPPEEALAVPDFRSPPPPPPPPKEEPPPPRKVEATPPPKPAPPKPAPPRPALPKPAPPRPAVAAAPQPAPSAPTAPVVPAAPVTGAVAPAAGPSIAPGWNAQLASWLASHKRYPSAARERGEEGEVQVRFTVESDGRVTDVAIARSSGHADLDTATLAMLQGATLPPPGAAATRTVRIHFRLAD